MKGSPAKAYVVYAPVEVIGGEKRLLSACSIQFVLPSVLSNVNFKVLD